MSIPQAGSLLNGYSYFKHGYGCAVRGPDWAVDFDFGECGQIDGFCPYRLEKFAQRRGGYELNSETLIKEKSTTRLRLERSSSLGISSII